MNNQTNDTADRGAIKLPVRYDADVDRIIDADGDSVARLEITTPGGHVKDYPEWRADRIAQAQQIVDALNVSATIAQLIGAAEAMLSAHQGTVENEPNMEDGMSYLKAIERLQAALETAQTALAEIEDAR